MRLGDAMGVSVRVGATTLKVLSADEASVDVDPGERNRAQFLKVEVEEWTVDAVQIWAETWTFGFWFSECT